MRIEEFINEDEVSSRLNQIASIVTDLFIQSKRNDSRLKRIECDVCILKREIAMDSGRLNDVFTKKLNLYNRLTETDNYVAQFNQPTFDVSETQRSFIAN